MQRALLRKKMCSLCCFIGTCAAYVAQKEYLSRYDVARLAHTKSFNSSDTYRLLHGFFDPSPDLSPSRPYQPEPEGQGLIRSEG